MMNKDLKLKIYDDEGNVTVKKGLDLGITIDERIADGYYFSFPFNKVYLLETILEKCENIIG